MLATIGKPSVFNIYEFTNIQYDMHWQFSNIFIYVVVVVVGVTIVLSNTHKPNIIYNFCDRIPRLTPAELSTAAAEVEEIMYPGMWSVEIAFGGGNMRGKIRVVLHGFLLFFFFKVGRDI